MSMNQNRVAEKVAKEAGKKVGTTKVFPANGTFEAISEAEKYAESQGYSVGSMCRDMPIALAKGNIYIAKWRNIHPSEYSRLDGLLLSDDFREGEVLFVEFTSETAGE